MNRYFYSMIAVLALAGTVALGGEAPLKAKKAFRKPNYRSLASHQNAPAPSGQGQQMLQHLTSTSPRFLNGSPQAGPVRIAGVCRGINGQVYQSSDRDYSSCIDARAPAVGAAVNNYSGPAQRQAGVGVLVGN